MILKVKHMDYSKLTDLYTLADANYYNSYFSS